MRGDWPGEIVRVLDNWAMWVVGGRYYSNISPFPAYRLAQPGPRYGNVMPILCAEAERADRLISAMSPRWAQPIRMHYLWIMRSDHSRAMSCNCSVNTYKARLNEAHALFENQWYSIKVSSLIA
jgi:hypothetical protein